MEAIRSRLLLALKLPGIHGDSAGKGGSLVSPVVGYSQGALQEGRSIAPQVKDKNSELVQFIMAI